MVKTAVTRNPQLLIIRPESELEFVGDPSQVNTSQIVLQNTTDRKIGFKVLTNAPHLFFVRPAFEVILPYSQCCISVMVQPPNSKELENFRHHKLMIQSIVVQPESTESIDKFIARNANSPEIMETKLICAFKTTYTSELELPLAVSGDDSHDGTGSRGNEMPGFGDDIMKFQESLRNKSSTQMKLCLLAVVVAVVAFLAYYFYFGVNVDGDAENETED
ncbi:hypothetical protein HELRODRAFT_188838 [Helobdella robusta]|uniref:MSP domain-containing protein n=1 Tax=Helobdella robusta TaxID=6412 RepID=T1FQE7_HELRO|nr:hypothetical protein HELRODRAFT_188838 [Helobdella robusta]ESN98623.1 hypothetical protein HELRODRAFT_188838 [Helobdella robusta]